MPRKHFLRINPVIVVFMLCALCASDAFAQQTQRQYLSGHGKDDAIPWQFRCSAGQQSGKWATIPVPSNWELHNFGIFSYGTDGKPKSAVRGEYRTTFKVPADWEARRVYLVFEGAMTDTEARVNDQPAGPIHQGGYYRFKYEVTRLLKPGQENTLDVTVDDESADSSINNAERRADYWNFAGIYRPVYLEAVPAEFIDRVAIDARADGTIAVSAFSNGVTTADTVEAQVMDLEGRAVGEAFTQPVSAAKADVVLQGRIDAPRQWTAETPNLYQLEVRLKQGATVIHAMRSRFGFRTMEVRAGDGLYVNGRRVVLKGSDRHSFWPDSGRCTSEQLSRDDIRLMQEMNMNAVRMSHYPPDQHFLDACDEMGLYVLDELGGWQKKYDEATARRLVEEMVKRDVNHPSILLWDNGNEGGWNPAVDGDFVRWDPQRRHVLHPWANFGDIDTKHYPDYTKMQAMCSGNVIAMPTEFLHGLYDGGAGAGLDDYWKLVQQSKVAAGGFIWAFVDESVKRVDLDGRLDGHGSNAPDGIVGPYREREASFYCIKQIWSPIIIEHTGTIGGDFNGELPLQNRYSFTDASQCTFSWQLRAFGPREAPPGYTILASGQGKTGSIAPGTGGILKLDLPLDWRRADALSVHAVDPNGRELWTWVWPIQRDGGSVGATPTQAAAPTVSESADRLSVRAADLTLAFSKTTGMVVSATRGDRTFALTNGPRLVSQPAVQPAPTTREGQTRPAATAPAESTAVEGKLISLRHSTDGRESVIEAAYDGSLKSVQWRISPEGHVRFNYVFNLRGPQEYFGVGFDFAQTDMKSMKWLGHGPYRVWKNRLTGGMLGVWKNDFNNTITGSAGWLYPEFSGYYADVRWAQFQTPVGAITAELASPDLYLQVLRPTYPQGRDSRYVSPPFPQTGIGFMHGIPAIGTKFRPAWVSGPQSQPAVAEGEYSGSVSLSFGN